MLESDDYSFSSFSVLSLSLGGGGIGKGGETLFQSLSLFRRLTIDLVSLLVLNLGLCLVHALSFGIWCRRSRLKMSGTQGGRCHWASFVKFGRTYKFNSYQPSIKMALVGRGSIRICLNPVLNSC